MIKISVRDIPSEGLDIDQSIPKEGIGLSSEEADIRSLLNVKARLEKVNNFIIADTRIQAQFGYRCARCLEELFSTKERFYKFDFEIDPSTEYIDLGEEIRQESSAFASRLLEEKPRFLARANALYFLMLQEIIMSNPSKVLCSKDCKGICPQCGANLNKEQCRCAGSVKSFMKNERVAETGPDAMNKNALKEHTIQEF